MPDRAFLDGSFRALDDATRAELERRLEASGRFETLLVAGGRAVDVPAHLERLGDGVSLPIGSAEIREAAERLAADWHGAGRLRIVLTDPPAAGIAITVAPYSPPDAADYESGVAVQLLATPVIESGDPTRRTKSLSWRRAAAGLAARGVFEGLLRNETGALVEGLRSNVVVIGAEPLTPPVSDGCLPGTVRRRLLEAGVVREGRVDAGAVRGAEVLLTNSLVGVLPVASVDGAQLPAGPRGRELTAFWRRMCIEL